MDPNMKENLKAAGFDIEVKRIEQGECPLCGTPIKVESEFRDEKSKKEFGISGICQKCQDKIFGV